MSIEDRNREIRSILPFTEVSLQGIPEELLSQASGLCRFLGLDFGTFVRAALAAKTLDGSPQLSLEHLHQATDLLMPPTDQTDNADNNELEGQ